MQRFGMMIKLRPGSEETYRRYHAAVWPEVLDKLKDCNIRNYSIYLTVFSSVISNTTARTWNTTGAKWLPMARLRNGGPLCSRCRNPSRRVKRANGGQPWKRSSISTEIFTKFF